MHVVTCVPKTKINLDGGNSQNLEGSETKVIDMEVDEVNGVPTWATRKITVTSRSGTLRKLIL